MRHFLYLVILLLLTTFSCSQTKTDTADTEQMVLNPEPIPTYPKQDKQLNEVEIKTLIKEAETERIKAAELGHEWRYTSKFIKEAKDFLKKGDMAKAQSKAETALFEGKMGQWQAKEADYVWKITVPR